MRAARVRLAVVVAGVAVVAAVIATADPLGPSARRRVRRRGDPAGDRRRHDPAARIVGASEVDFRTILGAISVFTLLGLLFAFLYVAFSRWSHSEFFTGAAAPARQRLPLLQLHDAHHDRLRQPRPGRDGRPVVRRPRDARRPDLPRHARRGAREPVAPRQQQERGRWHRGLTDTPSAPRTSSPPSIPAG